MNVTAATPTNAVREDGTRYIAEASMELQIPLAPAWTKGMEIKNDQGDVLFRVAEHSNGGTDLSPKYTVVLNSEGGSTLSRIEFQPFHLPTDSPFKTKGGRFASWCKIYFDQPSYTGQPPSDTGKLHRSTQPLYLHGKLFCKTYSGPKKKDTVFKFKAVGSTTKVIEFTEPATGTVKLTRDQTKGTISVAAGENVLEAVSLAYVIDRRYKIFGSDNEKKARPYESMGQSGARQGRNAAARSFGAA